MGDLIERKDAPAKLIALQKDNAEYSCENDIMHGKDIAYENAMDIIARMPAVNRWISCAERLPEVYEKVLTYSDDGIIHDNFRLNLRDGSVGWSQGWGITHWQPRPEPPEKE